ncbi:hypothetical protein E2542_SST09269 [Spatholobus suberectus]|nr:hypothetical protein E2542_SST09269 [Spatholobus suberectus]
MSRATMIKQRILMSRGVWVRSSDTRTVVSRRIVGFALQGCFRRRLQRAHGSGSGEHFIIDGGEIRCSRWQDYAFGNKYGKGEICAGLLVAGREYTEERIGRKDL